MPDRDGQDSWKYLRGNQQNLCDKIVFMSGKTALKKKNNENQGTQPMF